MGYWNVEENEGIALKALKHEEGFPNFLPYESHWLDDLLHGLLKFWSQLIWANIWIGVFSTVPHTHMRAGNKTRTFIDTCWSFWINHERTKTLGGLHSSIYISWPAIFFGLFSLHETLVLSVEHVAWLGGDEWSVVNRKRTVVDEEARDIYGPGL